MIDALPLHKCSRLCTPCEASHLAASVLVAPHWQPADWGSLVLQAALAERLSELLLQLPEQVALLYYAASLKTLRREWFGIDHLRLNKFLMLIRKFLNQTLRLLQASSW